jgi:hypothetical protein
VYTALTVEVKEDVQEEEEEEGVVVVVVESEAEALITYRRRPWDLQWVS